MVIQTISLLDQMDKDINTFSMRIKEWFSYHFPELAKIVPESANYIKLVDIIRSREDLTEDKLDQIEEVIQDHEKAVAIFEVAKTSMGRLFSSSSIGDFSPRFRCNGSGCGESVFLCEKRPNFHGTSFESLHLSCQQVDWCCTKPQHAHRQSSRCSSDLPRWFSDKSFQVSGFHHPNSGCREGSF